MNESWRIFFCFNPPPIWRHSYVERERRDEPGRNQLTSRDLLFFSGPCSKVVGFYTSMWEIKTLRQSRRLSFLNLASLKIKCFASEFVTEIIRTQKLCIICTLLQPTFFPIKQKRNIFIWKNRLKFENLFYGEYLFEKLLSQLGMHFPTGVCSE